MSHFEIKTWVEFWFRQWLNFYGQNDSKNFLIALREKIVSFWSKKMSHLSWDKKHLNWKKHLLYCGYPTGNGQSSIIAKAVN